MKEREENRKRNQSREGRGAEGVYGEFKSDTVLL